MNYSLAIATLPIFSTVHLVNTKFTHNVKHTHTHTHNGQYITIIINVCCGCTNCVFLMAWLCTTPSQYPSIWGRDRKNEPVRKVKKNTCGKIRDELTNRYTIEQIFAFQTRYRIPRSPRSPSHRPSTR